MGSKIEGSRDVIVIGAGPAGSMTALLLARAGMQTTLVERKIFPRPKVCGGCLNARAVGALGHAGVLGRLVEAGAQAVNAVVLRHGGRSASLALPAGLALSRSTMDAALAGAAAEAGCEIVSGTAAIVSPEGPDPWREGFRRVVLQRPHEQPWAVAARVVVVADGLAHSSLRECSEFHSRVRTASRIGTGALVAPGAVEIGAGAITMAIGRHGYVGAVGVEEGLINVAAALDPAFVKECGSPGVAVRTILDEAGVGHGHGVAEADWTGTIPLSRFTPRLGARRLFVVGDAAGYVEPFTGEGMAWAFAGAHALVPFVREGLGQWRTGLDGRWSREFERVVRREQWWCQSLARVLRYRSVTAVLVEVLRRRPGLAEPLLAHLSVSRPS